MVVAAVVDDDRVERYRKVRKEEGKQARNKQVIHQDSLGSSKVLITRPFSVWPDSVGS